MRGEATEIVQRLERARGEGQTLHESKTETVTVNLFFIFAT
jgi:hypothetical protein